MLLFDLCRNKNKTKTKSIAAVATCRKMSKEWSKQDCLCNFDCAVLWQLCSDVDAEKSKAERVVQNNVKIFTCFSMLQIVLLYLTLDFRLLTFLFLWMTEAIVLHLYIYKKVFLKWTTVRQHYLLCPSITQLMWRSTESANSRNTRMLSSNVESFFMPVWFMVIRLQKSLLNAYIPMSFQIFGKEVHFQQECNDSQANQTICHRVNEITSLHK